MRNNEVPFPKTMNGQNEIYSNGVHALQADRATHQMRGAATHLHWTAKNHNLTRKTDYFEVTPFNLNAR